MKDVSWHFDFECYGSRIRVAADTPGLLKEARSEISSVIPGVREIDADGEFAAVFELRHDDDGNHIATTGGELVSSQPIAENFYRVLTTFLRMAIAENAPELLFMHAGAVGWKGKGLIFPGDSFVGKSTLVAELVKLGAVYYSDDYAVFDSEGNLHAFPRDISMRSDDGRYVRFRLPPEELGGTVGDRPIPVGTIWMTRFDRSAEWEPEKLTPGQGILEMMPYTFAFVDRPNFSLPILNKVASNAIILTSKRGSADIFAKTFLDFVDKTAD